MTKKIPFLQRVFILSILSCLFLGYSSLSFAKWINLDKNNPSSLSNSLKSNTLSTQKSTTQGQILGFELDKINYKGKDFLNISFWDDEKDSAFTSEVGFPKLPMLTRIVEFYNDKSELEISFSGTNSYFNLNKEANLPIFPIQASTPKIQGAFEQQSLLWDEKFYSRDEFYPKKDYEIKSTIYLRGRSFALVNFYPLKYNPSKGILQIKKSFSINVKNKKLLAHIKSSSSKLNDESEVFQKFFSDLNMNYPLSPLRRNESDNALSSYKDTLLIIAGDAFADQALLSEYIKIKKTQGYQVILKKVSQIASNVNDLSIRNYVKSVYTSTNPKLAYLLILGDVNHVPTHMGKAAGSFRNNPSDIKMNLDPDTLAGNQATDLYYAAIDRPTYEEDLGGPDLLVGRLSVNTLNEFETVFHKLLRYSTAQFDDFSWTKKSSFLATDDRYEVAEGTHNYVMSSYTTKAPWEHKGNFPVTNQAGGDKLYAVTHHANTQNLLNMFNEGRTIINYSGHGATTYWAGPTFKESDIKKINHEDAMPFVISNACITNSFAMTSGDCFGEMWLKHPYGAIGFLGASNNSYWDEDDILERAFYKTLFESDNKSIGNAFSQSILAVWRNYNGGGASSYYAEIYNLLGDPSLELYMDVPKILSVSYPQEYIYGTGSIEVSVQTQDQGPAKMAHVTVMGPNLQKTFKTNSQGIAQIILAPEDINVGDKLSFTVHAYGQIPYQGEILVLANSHSYLAHASHEILGDVKNLQVGGNGEISLSLKNIGTIDSGEIKASVEVDNASILIKQKTLHFTNIAAGDIGEAINPIIYEVRKGIQDQSVVTFTITWESENGANKGKTTFKEIVSAANLNLLNSSAMDTSGNMNGKIDPGEEGQISIKIKNTGHLPLLSSDSSYTLESKIQGVEILTPTVALDHDLSVGEEATLHFQIKIPNDGSIPSGTIVKFLFSSHFQGVLKSFDLDQLIGTLVTKNLATTTNLPMNIPDNNANGISAIINNPDGFKIDDIKIKVKITHTYIGDLQVILVTPSGKKIKLHDKSGSSQDNIDCIYGETCQSAESLSSLKGENGQGVFTLKVIDNAGSDVGTLDSFSLNLSGY